MTGIFISYRRDDSAAYAGRLYDRLVNHFGHDRVFMDIADIEPGEDFTEVIKKNLAAVEVAIILIGKQWLDIRDSTGRRRLDDPEDFVRLEVAAILERKIRAIPVLVGNAVMPKSSQLPDPLVPLMHRNALEISDLRFHSDAQILIETLEKIVVGKVAVNNSPPTELPLKKSSGSMIKIGAASIVALGVLFIGLLLLTNEPDGLPPSTESLDGLPENSAQGIQINLPQQDKAILQAAEQGDADAQYNLGLMYAEGRDVMQDNNQALKWFREAAEQGDPRAQSDLGFMYDEGRGVTQDHKQALEWYLKAVEQGYPLAQNNLGVMYAEGRGVAQDNKKALEWYRKAAEQGDADAQYNLGWMYENGLGVAKDGNKALEWYRKAADQENSDAQAALRERG